MKKFFSKVGGFFWSRGFLKFVLWTITMMVLLYMEEDWRGARAWAATKAEWEAKGETFDLNKFVPPPVPDGQNLAAIPLYKMEMIKEMGGAYPVVLRQAIRYEGIGRTLPSRGNWMVGELPDMAKVRQEIAADYASAFKNATMPDSALAQLDTLFPFIDDLTVAAAMRPLCRLDLDYTTFPPAARSLSLLTDQIKMSQILTLHATLALDQHQPDVALSDMKANYQLLAGPEHNPTLVGGFVALGMNALAIGAIYDGLAHHAWSDAQLIEIDRALAPIDFLADYQFDFKSMAADSVANIDYYKRAAPKDMFAMLGINQADSGSYFRMMRYSPAWPGGWWDENKRQEADFILRQMASVDLQSRQVFPELNRDLQAKADQAQARWDAYAPWNIWVTLNMGPLKPSMEKFARGQVWVDETRIACALERYRLARGVYPNSLEALVPDYLAAIPHDIMNGQPYHYNVRPDGIFLLYSVGGNQKDDGGKVVYPKDNPRVTSFDEGDWTWPTPQPESSK